MHNKSHKLDSASFRTFMFQGKAFFTLHNLEKDTHITFRIKSLKKKRHEPERTRFFDVYVKALNDKYQGNRYIGRIDRTEKSFKPVIYIEQDHVGIKTINWLIANWNNLEQFEAQQKLAIYHLGVCCKCGLPLTVPESIQNGIGPQCMKYREGKSIEVLKEHGLYKPGKGYVDMVMEALDVNPGLYDQIFIPDVVRRTSEWFQRMTLYSDFGII